MKCKNCIYLVKTKEYHNGDKNEIREYNHCSKIFKDDYEMEYVVECEAFKEEKYGKGAYIHLPVSYKTEEELSKGKKPRKQPDGNAWKKKIKVTKEVDGKSTFL